MDLLVQIIHRISVRAERKVEKEILNDLRRVSNKYGILFNLAQKAVDNPEGIIRDVIFPVVSEQTLKDLIKEFKHTDSAYREKIHTVIRASYGSHYRRMVPEILSILHFRSNNEAHQPVIRALELIQKYADSGLHYFPITEDIPIEGVIRSVNREIVVEKDDKGQERINRINYEISALQALRDKLRCKEIWVVGANRYRNPDEDLPADFEERREENYKALKQPLDAEAFITTLKQAMSERPDYAYLKSLFQHLRTELEIEVPKASKKLPYVPTEDELKRYYEVVWKSKNFQDMMIVKTLMYTGIRPRKRTNQYSAGGY